MHATKHEPVPRFTSRRGFTLIELMVVVTILAILTIVAITSYRYYNRRAYAQEARSMLLEMKMKQEQYFSEYGQYVSSSAGVANSDFFPTVKAIEGDGGAGDRWSWSGMNCVSPPNAVEGAFCSLGFKPSGATYWQIVTRGWGPTDGPTSLTTGYPIIDNMALTKRWYYAIATRDSDNDGIFAVFIITSQTNEVIGINEIE
jgi:prepilin-type N-terminal cleavage/methylation domain-containing protein